MIGIKNSQIDRFDFMIFEKLIPQKHLLVKIDSIIDFSFVYDLVKAFYSSIGRKSEDPVMMFKTLLLVNLTRTRHLAFSYCCNLFIAMVVLVL